MAARVKVVPCACLGQKGFTRNPDISVYPSLSRRGLWVHAACGRPTRGAYEAWKRRVKKA